MANQVISDATQAVGEGNAGADVSDLRQTIVFKRRDLVKQAWRLRLGSATSTLRGAIDRLRDGRYTAVVDFQGSLKSALLARATSCAERIGLAPGHGREGSHLLYTCRVDPGEADGPVSAVARA